MLGQQVAHLASQGDADFGGLAVADGQVGVINSDLDAERARNRIGGAGQERHLSDHPFARYQISTCQSPQFNFVNVCFRGKANQLDRVQIDNRGTKPTRLHK